MARLHTLLCFHLPPIMYNGSSCRDLIGATQRAALPFPSDKVLCSMARLGRALILRWASYLDAFSSYPLRTWLPSVYRGHDNWHTSGASLPVLSY